MNPFAPRKPERCIFFVDGKPVAQGSMRAPRAGVVLHSSDNLKGWRDAIGWAARIAFKGEPWTGPIELELQFTFAKKGADAVPKVTAPDLDKLIRAVCDALTGIIFLDDRQVSRVAATKEWADASFFHHVPGLEVAVAKVYS